MSKKIPESYLMEEERISIGDDPFSGLAMRGSTLSPNKLYYRDDPNGAWVYQANCLEFMDYLIAKYPEGKFDMIFADPPYFLYGGIACHAGKMVKVDKGEWGR